MAEINVGQISEALNDKVDRDNRNVDNAVGADAVIEYQMPSADNGYTWYRKYKSGWVEQGGHFDKGGLVLDTSNLINLIIPMSNINYTLVTQSNRNDDVNGGINNQCFIIYRTTTQFRARCYGDGTSQYIDWQVSGMAA